MTTQIERVARALHEWEKYIADSIAANRLIDKRYSIATWEETPESARDAWREQAKVAIRAMTDE